jgi:type IV pilus assembly protein PilF
MMLFNDEQSGVKLAKKLRVGLTIALFVSAALTGCASKLGGASGGTQAEIITESDEPETRKRARIRLELAVGYFEQGQTTVALDELKQSLLADPSFPEAHNLRGLIYMRLNDPRLAEESFRRALTINPRDPNVLHNFGWMLCQQARYPESQQALAQAIANPTYGGRAKSWMAQGLCQVRAGQVAEAEQSLLRSYELDAGNPVTGYNLATLLYQRGDFTRAQFYVRRLNNSELANAESLWLGIKVERQMENREAMQQLAGQLKKRFAQSRELAAFERSAFNE